MAGHRQRPLGLPNVNLGPNSCAIVGCEILNVVQVFSPAQAVTVCLLLLLLLFSGQQAENAKKPG